MKKLVHRIKRSSLDKPLPSRPSEDDEPAAERQPVLSDREPAQDATNEEQARRKPIAAREDHPQRQLITEEERQRKPPHADDHHVPQTPILADEANTQRSADTTVYTSQAPAVTHEIVRRVVHEHEETHITREIHQHHIHHRVLPVHDVQVLPAVHYVHDHKGFRQVTGNEIPASWSGRHLERAIDSTLKKSLPKDNTAAGPRQFSAREFGAEEQYKEQDMPGGGKRTEQWWVHPPELETGGQESGQTKAFHFDLPGDKKRPTT